MKLLDRSVVLGMFVALAAGCGGDDVGVVPMVPDGAGDVVVDALEDAQTPEDSEEADVAVEDVVEDAPEEAAVDAGDEGVADVEPTDVPVVTLDAAADASTADAPSADVVVTVDAPRADVVVTVDAPRADIPATDVPRTDVITVDAPRTDVITVDVPRTDVITVDAPRPDVAVMDAPRPDVITVDAPRPDVITVDAPRPDVITVDAPRPDVITVDAPRVDVPVDMPVAPRCGDRVINPGEECDDGNTTRWDGCSNVCRLEQTMRVDSAALMGGGSALTRACDLTSDGVNDNRLGQALTDLALGQVNTGLQTSFTSGATIVLSHFLDLDDRLGVNDPSLRIAFFEGIDAVAPFDGTAGEAFAIRATALDSTRSPVSFLSPGTLVGRALRAGPGTAAIALALGGPSPTPLNLQRATTDATTTTDGAAMRVGTLTAGRLCGAIPAGDLDRIPAPTSLPAQCLSTRGGTSLLDAVVNGCAIVFIQVINAQQPDIDLGGDGIFQGGTNRALRDTNGDRIVDTCRDTRTGVTITGDDCAQDPRFDDAYSTALTYTARRVVITQVR